MLHYESRGDGADTKLLLHGFLGSGRNLASLARRWTDSDPSLRLILPDLSGHGISAAIAPERGLRGMAEDLLELADRLGIPKPLNIVGHSMGGRVALRARILDPHAVGEVTLLDISPRPMGRLAGDLQRLLERLLQAPAETSSRDDMRQFFLDDGLSAPLTDWVLMNLLLQDGVYRWRIDREGLAAMHQRDIDVDLWEAVETPGLRARCIRGALSAFVSESDKARLESAGVPVTTLANAGHFVHVDAQQALLQALQEG